MAVDDVGFGVSAGEVVGLLGPNGAGKTTTIKCLCTLIIPTSGTIVIDGVDAVQWPRAAVSKVSAVLEGNRNIYWRMTVKENLEFFAALNGVGMNQIRSYREELIERFDLSSKATTAARMLSRGMQQKLAVACAFIKQTPVLLLDEPTLGLDVETSHELRLHLKEMASAGERTILLSSHDMDVVQDVCDRVIIINEGRIVTDDRVANLLELFKARAYLFEVGGLLSDSQRMELARTFPMSEISSDAHSTSIRVELLEPNSLFELIDLLRRCEVTIESIGRMDPDLEEIFLRIVKGVRA